MNLPVRITLHDVIGEPFGRWFAAQRKRDNRKPSPLEWDAAKLFLCMVFPERFPVHGGILLNHPKEVGSVAKYAREYLRFLSSSKKGRARLALLLYAYHHPAPPKQPPPPARVDAIVKKYGGWRIDDNGAVVNTHQGWRPHDHLSIKLYRGDNFLRAVTPAGDWFDVDLSPVDVQELSRWAALPYLKERYGLNALDNFGAEDFRNAVKALRKDASIMFTDLGTGLETA